MSLLAQAPRPVMSAPTGFHANGGRPQIGHPGESLAPTAAFAQDDLPAGIHAHQVQYTLGNIDPNDAQFLRHGARLLGWHDSDNLYHSSGVLPPLRIGAGPFH